MEFIKHELKRVSIILEKHDASLKQQLFYTKPNFQSGQRGRESQRIVPYRNNNISHLLSFSLFFFLYYLSITWNLLASPRGWSFNHWFHLLVFFKGNHPQVWGVLQHHLCHQITCNRPCLVLSCLLAYISPKFTIIIFRPPVLQ